VPIATRSRVHDGLRSSCRRTSGMFVLTTILVAKSSPASSPR
jgi:hypothetical protein